MQLGANILATLDVLLPPQDTSEYRLAHLYSEISPPLSCVVSSLLIVRWIRIKSPNSDRENLSQTDRQTGSLNR